MNINCCEHCADLLRRMAALEEQVFRKHSARNAIFRVIDAWPGPFTPQQILKALLEFEPEVAAGLKQFAVDQQIKKLERDGVVSRTVQGNGRNAAVFEVVGEMPKTCGRPGPKYGRRASYESGARNIIRTALNDLPEEFNLDDFKAWCEKKIPDVQIPYGSLSSTLYKLEQSEELVCSRRRHYLRGKYWKRGPKRVMPSGDEIKELEKAWQEFRSGMNVETPERLTPLERGEAS